MERVPKFSYSSAVRIRGAQKSNFTRAFHCCINLGWKLPPHPQNTSAVVGNLKFRSGSIVSWVLSEIPPINSVQTRSKKKPKNQTLPNIKKSYRVQKKTK